MRRAITRGHAAVAVVFCGLPLAIGACGSGAASAGRATSSAAAPARTSAAAMQGPRVPHAACQAAVRAQQALQASQARDNTDQTALDADFTKFANALNNDAGRETNSAAARAMTNLADDYTNLVQSQTGNARLPDMTTVENDGTTFSRDCGG